MKARENEVLLSWCGAINNFVESLSTNVLINLDSMARSMSPDNIIECS